MAMTDLGLIGIANRGTYSASATYMKGNFVYYEGSTYLALLDNLTGVTPTPDMVNWQLLAAGSGDYSRSMTKAEFDVLTPQEKHGRIIVTDEDLHAATAAQIGYNDSVTGLGADDVQEAIAAVAGKIGDTDISGIGDGTVTGGVSAISSRVERTRQYTLLASALTIPANNASFSTTVSGAIGYSYIEVQYYAASGLRMTTIVYQSGATTTFLIPVLTATSPVTIQAVRFVRAADGVLTIEPTTALTSQCVIHRLFGITM